MKSIKHLAKAVHSSLRSSAILFDLTRVVEELVYNSVDADATKVLVCIGVGSCYVRVEDDGCGITRDGLVLVGEKYATSKLHCLAELDGATGSFGFRGEALGSLSDVSLLEVVSKARGMPNGYRKVIKGCKCLYLGIDDNRHDVGTTVIVRDLFYNQPVRRKYMQSSPKRILYAVKNRVFRIALVYPQLSFKVIDVESEDELLCTHPAPSPITLVTNGFGNEISSSLCKIHFYDDLLKLSGYLSGPGATFPTKAFQYIYINSRFICKGSIHKLLNDLATSYNCWDLWKGEIESQNGKRSRTQAYPAYILNLCCPRSSYDLTFEPSKTLVEFKDWASILSFIEKAITRFWRKNIAQDELSRNDGLWKDDGKTASQVEEGKEGRRICMPPTCVDMCYIDKNVSPNSEIMKKKCRFQCPQTSLCLSPSSSSLYMPSDEGDFSSYRKKHRRSSGKFHRNTTEIKEQQTKTGFVHQNEYSWQDTIPFSRDASIDVYIPVISRESGGHQWAPNNDPSPVRDNFLPNELTAAITSNSNKRDYIDSRFGDGSLTVDTNTSEGLMKSLKSCSDVEYRYVENESGSRQWAIDNDFSPLRDDFLTNELAATMTSNDTKRDYMGSQFGDESLTVDANMSERSMESLKSCSDVEYRYIENNPFSLGCPKDPKKPFLQSCSLSGNLPSDKTLFKNIDVQVDGFKTKRKRHAIDDSIDVLDIDDSNRNFDFFRRTSWQDESSTSRLSSSLATKYISTSELDMLPRDFAELQSCAQDNDLPTDSFIQAGKVGLDRQCVKSKFCSGTRNHMFRNSPWKVEHIADEYALERSFWSCRSSSSGDYRCREEKDRYEVFSYDTMQNNSIEEDCLASCYKNTASDYGHYVSLKSDIFKFLHHGDCSDDILFPKVGYSEKLDDQTDWLCFDHYTSNNYAGPGCYIYSSSYDIRGDCPRNQLGSQNCGQFHVRTLRKRSRSAPPFYRGKSQFSPLYSRLTSTEGLPDPWTIHEIPTMPVATKYKDPQQSSGVSQQCFEPSPGEDPVFNARTCMKKMPDCTLNVNEIPRTEEFEKSPCFQISNSMSVEDIPKELDDLNFSGSKWRNSNSQSTDGDKTSNLHDLSNVLDISSGFLHLAGDSLVPESINKDYLEDAKVLLQVDKKYIPVIAGGTLAIIDQHAADERIRLEELRRKVLSGEGNTVAYLDSEQNLELPEFGFQLLHNYAEQIQKWGWICNIHAQGSRSFSKNLKLLHRQKSVVTLLAVPCILGVKLSDLDLLEFLEQLGETDGSTTIPPSILRVLNFKACRGAIMFGDSLLPSECSLIVEELKQTALCFQCAHGRPTTVPLVDLDALHKQINKLGLSSNEGDDESWHGLRRHRISLERATQRVSSARGQC